MKKLYFLITFLVLTESFAQETYFNSNTAYYNGKEEILDTEDASVEEITMCRDHKFVMWMRPMVSCFTWRSFKGSWTEKDNIYQLIESREITESDYINDYQRDKDNFYLIKFSTDHNTNLKGLKIEINYEYDYDFNIKDEKPTFFVLSDANEIRIPFTSIPNHSKLASIRTHFTFKNRSILAYLTQNEIVNKKTGDLANKIFLKIREEPQKDIVKNTIILEKKNDKLIVQSITKNKTKIPDYTLDLKMEKEYSLNLNYNGAYNCH